jgi:hypothetical protein
MHTNWTSKKQKPVISERREQLDFLFAFANTDLTVANSDQLKNQTYGFLQSMMAGQPANYSFTISAEQNELVQEIQKHLRARLKKVIHNTKFLWEMPLWKVGGSIEFTVDAKTKRFYERFRLRKIKPGNELKALKRMVDLALIEIIRDLDFKPNRFHQCPRCGNFFYQPTEKKSIYCSIRCGNAVRLQEFRKKKNKVMHKKSDESNLH